MRVGAEPEKQNRNKQEAEELEKAAVRAEEALKAVYKLHRWYRV